MFAYVFLEIEVEIEVKEKCCVEIYLPRSEDNCNLYIPGPSTSSSYASSTSTGITVNQMLPPGPVAYNSSGNLTARTRERRVNSVPWTNTRLISLSGR